MENKTNNTFVDVAPISPILLVDTDVFIWKHAMSNEIDWGDGPTYDTEEALLGFEAELRELTETLNSNKVILCLGEGRCFRYELLPEYKGTRPPKPEAVVDLYRVLKEKYKTVSNEGLECDDTLGILHTGAYVDQSIIVSTDKDMKTIPGFHFNPRKKELGVTYVSPKEAARFHMVQTLMGDSTDNIKGIPRVGVKTAEKWLNEKGYGWDSVLQMYESRGLSREDMLLNARLTRILQDGDLDEEGEVILWGTPRDVN